MCVIVAKPIKTKLPTWDILEDCFKSNPHGAGFMYTFANKVYIEKGYMTFGSLYKRIAELSKEINLYETPIVFHFRISTSGRINEGTCHPYPIDSRELTAVETVTNLGVVHNGIIPMFSTAEYFYNDSFYNDTQLFTWNVLTPLYELNHNFLDNDEICELIERLAESKLCFLTNDSELKLIGKFHEVNGNYYSNLYWKKRWYKQY